MRNEVTVGDIVRRLLEACELPVLILARVVITGVLLAEKVAFRRRMRRRVAWVAR